MLRFYLIRAFACLMLAAFACVLTTPRAEARDWPLFRGGVVVARGAAKAVLPPYPLARKTASAMIGVERRQARRACGSGLFGRCRR